MSSRIYELGSGAVLFVADLLQPVDHLPIQRLGDRNVRHRRRRRCAVPVFLTGLEPHDVARPDLLDRSAFALRAPKPGRHEQCLSERMRVPGGSRARLEGDDRAADARGRASLKRRIDPHDTRKPVAGTLC